MSKYYVISFYFISQNSNQVNLDDYTRPINGKDRTLSDALEGTLRIFYNSSPYQSDLLTPINVYESDERVLKMDLNFDFDKIQSKIDEVISTLKSQIDTVFKEAKTSKNGLPVNPKYTLIEDKSDPSVNTFFGPANGGGWKLLYRLDELFAVTTTTTTIVTTTTTTIPPQTTTTTTLPVQTTPNQPPAQEAGREERTGQNPNQPNTNQTAAPPGITNIFKNTFSPQPITLNFPADGASKKETASNTGFLPFVWYNTYQISYGDISFFQLYTDGVIPVVKMIFRDTANLMKDKGMPLDDSKIKIFINPRNNNLKPILLEFKITVFKVNGSTYTMAGVLDVNRLYYKEFKSYSASTSYKALQKIVSEMGLGFNSNLDDTNDSMTWINTGQRVYNFISKILETSYKSDESFLLGYIDFYYHFNYVDIEKELNRNLKEELGISSFGLEEAANIKDKTKLASMFLTNDKTHENSNTYISKYKIVNNSTSISLMEGYLTKVKYYDDVSKDLLVFDLDSITTSGDKIILKGAPQNNEFFEKNINLKYIGKLDVDNVHKNYNYSFMQNIRNLTELQKIALHIELSTPNFNIYRFQKIQVLITNSPTPSQKGFNNRLSGEWFITDVRFEMNRGKFIQKLQMVRRDLDLSAEELQQEAPQTQSSQNTNNSVEKTVNPTNLENTDVANNSQSVEITTTTTISPQTTNTTTAAPTNFDLDYIISDTSMLKDNSGKTRKLVLIGNAVVSEEIAVPFLRMQEAAKKEGVNIYINSGFRPAFGPRITVKSKKGKTVTVTTQESLRRDKSKWVQSVRDKYATDDEFVLKAPASGYSPVTAAPGSSNHGNGIALDLDTGSRRAFARVLSNQGKNYIWLVKNSWKFGFVRAVGSEEWHYEYRPSIANQGPYAKIADGESRLYYADLGISGLQKENLG